MRRLCLISLSMAYMALACGVPAAMAEPVQPSSVPAPQVAGWNELLDSLRALPDQLLAKLPPDERNDPQFQAEVGRLMLAALTSSALAALESDGDHPAFVPMFGLTLNMARPNADTVYRVAEITPGGTYRLRGRRGTLNLAKIGESGGKGAMVYHDINALRVGADDRYDVVLSPERPAGHTGDWWRLDPATNRLTLRMVSSDWSTQRDATVSIERVDRPAPKPRTPPDEHVRQLRRLAQAVPYISSLRLGWITKLRQDGYLNKFNMMNYTEAGLLAGQFYYEAAYDLKDDEALIVETTVPERCGYRSLILTDEMGGTIDWINNHSSLNESQAKPDKDGILRIVISAKDPGVPNWLDTAGYAQGGIQGRWTECSSQPVPTLRKVPLTDVRRHLPPETPVITPSERDRIIRDRRADFQQRPLW